MAKIPRVAPRLPLHEREAIKAGLGGVALLAYVSGLYTRELSYEHDLAVWRIARTQLAAGTPIPPSPVPAITWVDLVVGAVIATVLLVQVLAGRAKDRSAAEQRTPRDLEGCSTMLFELIRQQAGLPDDDYKSFRLTVHAVVDQKVKGEEPTVLEQLLPYPGGRREDAGRKSSIRAGIIGRVAREGKPLALARTTTDDAGFDAEMIREWSYNEEEAKRLTRDRRSWMAIPIFAESPSKVYAVLYLDSNQDDFFNEAIRKSAVRGGIALAHYMGQRYR